jgi:hypothetical protein
MERHDGDPANGAPWWSAVSDRWGALSVWWAASPLWQKIVLLCVAIYAGAAALGILSSVKDGPNGGSDDNSAYVKIACRDWVKERLKAPATADFANETVSKAGNRYTVIGAVDAENSFGAKIRTPFVCTATHDGEASTLVDLQLD